MDAEEKRLAMLYFRWDEVAPLLRGMYARQLDGFGQEQPQPSAESPAFHSETVAVYPGDKNHLPYDVVVERLHIEEPEPPAPVTEPEKTFEEVLCIAAQVSLVFLIGGFLGSFGIGEGLPLAVDLNGNRVFIQHFLKGFFRLCYRGWRLRLLNMQPFHHHIIR